VDICISADALRPGVTVNHGAIVGAGVIVLKDVKAWMIVVGQPARESKDAKFLNEHAISRTGTFVSAHPRQE
jgi:serine acetyltransferase